MSLFHRVQRTLQSSESALNTNARLGGLNCFYSHFS